MKILTLFTLLLFGVASFADSGGAGNGAGGWLCEDDKVEIADLYEATIRGHITDQGLTIVRDNKTPVDQQVEDMILKIKNLNAEFGKDVEKAYHDALNDKFEATPGSIRFPHDVLNDFQKPGCKPVGIGVYFDENNSLFLPKPASLHIDFDILKNKMLSNTDAAAFWIHESIYLALRRFDPKITDSRYVRKLVGLLFSDLHPSEYPADLQFSDFQEIRRHIAGDPNSNFWTRFIYFSTLLYSPSDKLKFVVEAKSEQCSGSNGAVIIGVKDRLEDKYDESGRRIGGSDEFTYPVDSVIETQIVKNNSMTDSYQLQFYVRPKDMAPGTSCFYTINFLRKDNSIFASIDYQTTMTTILIPDLPDFEVNRWTTDRTVIVSILSNYFEF